MSSDQLSFHFGERKAMIQGMPSRILVTSPSPHRLEDEACRVVLERASTPGARVLVGVPTRLLVDRLHRALASAVGPGRAVLGVEVAHHRRIAERVLDAGFVRGLVERPLGLLGTLPLQRLAFDAATASSWDGAGRVAARPRMVRSLLRTLEEVREAGVAPGDLAASGARGLGEVLARFEEGLARAERDLGLTDAAGHAMAATVAARRLRDAGALPWTHVIHHGAYELVATQAALVDALGLPLVVLAPSGRGPAFAAARRALARWPGETVERIELDAPDGGALLDVDALFDEDRDGRTIALPDPRSVEAFTVRGSRGVMDLAAALAAEAHLKRGVALEDVVVLARTLEPFAAHLEDAFGARGVPFTTNAGAPALREPWAQSFLLLLEALAADLPRAVVMELLRSAETQMPDAAAEDVTPDLWDAWTRAAAVTGGRASYDDVLGWHASDLADRARRTDGTPHPERGEQRARRLGRLLAIVDALEAERRAWSTCGSREAHAECLRGLASRWLRPPSRPGAVRAREAVHAALDELELAGRVGDSVGVDVAAVRAEITSALEATSFRLGSEDGSGVRVLGSMPARGLPFREVILVGVEQGLFPRRERQDPFLSERVRGALQRSRPGLAAKSQGAEEERTLLASALAAGASRCTLAWQRADEDGRTRAASPYLREIARVALGVADADAFARREGDGFTVVPAHPAMAARLLRERTSTATWREALMECSELHGRRAAVGQLAEATGRASGDLASSLAKVGVLDAFRAEGDGGLAHDALLGGGLVPVPSPLSASSLEELGRCGLRWWLRRGLRAEELVEPVAMEEIAAAQLGSVVHAALEAAYADAIRRGGDASAVRAPRTLEVLREAFSAGFRDEWGRRRDALPLLHDVSFARWSRSLEAFVVDDARRLGEDGARVAHVEHEVVLPVSIGPGGTGRELVLRGRFDRVVETADGWRVDDFKTGRSLERMMNPTNAVKGHQLQGLAYLLLAREWAAAADHRAHGRGAEVHVTFVPLHPDTLGDADERTPKRLELDGSSLDGARETLAVLIDLLDGGAFPSLEQSFRCRWCAHKAACRRNHVPSVERLLALPLLDDHRDIQHKSTRKPLLVDVRGGAP